MTKNELIRILEQVPGDPEIIIREIDAPECGRRVTDIEIEQMMFRHCCNGRGDIYDRRMDFEEAEMTSAEWNKFKKENDDVIVITCES